MKRVLKIVAIVVASLVGLLLVITLLAGPIVKAYVEKHSLELCHRVVTMDHLRINIFFGSVTIVGLEAKEENAKDKFFSFDKLRVNISLPRLLAKTVRINHVHLDNLEGQVIQDGIQFNFSDIIDFYTSDTPEDESDEPSAWKVDIRDIRVNNAAVLYKDLRMGSVFDSREVNIHVPKLDLEGGPSHLDMTTVIRNAGNFSIVGDYNIMKGDFNAEVLSNQIDLKLAWPYLKHVVNASRLSGILNGDAKIKGSVNHMENLNVSGTLSIQDLLVCNADETPLTSFQAFDLDIKEVDLGKMIFNINKMSLQSPDIHFEIFEDGNTVTRLLSSTMLSDSASTSEPEKDTVETSSSKGMALSDVQYRIGNMSITGGQIVYTDHSVKPQMQEFTVSDLTLNIHDMGNGKPSPITLTAKLGSSGTLSCEANADVLNLSNADVVLDISNVALSDFSPYSLYYLAYPAEKGLITFTSDLSIRDNWLDSQNQLDIYKPTFGNKVKDIKPAAAKLPMKAAMYVITDRTGHATMDLPVKGDISSPTFSFRKIIWKTFTNLLIKIAASPVDLIAKSMGKNSIKPMEYAADGQLKLSNEDVFQLNELADMLKSKDQMVMVLRIGAAPLRKDGETEAAWKARTAALESKAEEMVRAYMINAGIPATRVVTDKANRPEVSENRLKVVLGLEMQE